jgi:hypothetical protein
MGTAAIFAVVGTTLPLRCCEQLTRAVKPVTVKMTVQPMTITTRRTAGIIQLRTMIIHSQPPLVNEHNNLELEFSNLILTMTMTTRIASSAGWQVIVAGVEGGGQRAVLLVVAALSDALSMLAVLDNF